MNLPEQIPKELQTVRSDLDDNFKFIDKCQGNAVLRCFMTHDGKGSYVSEEHSGPLSTLRRRRRHGSITSSTAYGE